MTTVHEAPLKPKEVAQMLNVSTRSIYRMVGLEWVEYQVAGVKPIRRVTPESVRRLLERRRGE